MVKATLRAFFVSRCFLSVFFADLKAEHVSQNSQKQIINIGPKNEEFVSIFASIWGISEKIANVWPSDVEFGPVQTCANLVDLETFCKFESLLPNKSASIQPRTKNEKFVRSPCTDRPSFLLVQAAVHFQNVFL